MDGLIRWRPFREMMPWRPFGRRWEREFEDLWRSFEEGFGPEEEGLTRWTPRVETFRKDGDYVVKADLPGVDPQDIHISVEGDRLVLRGERKMDREEKRRGYHRREVFYGSFERTVPVPKGLDPDQVKARYHNGVLEITAPVGKEEGAAREIKIEVEKEKSA